MKIVTVNSQLTISSQLSEPDLPELAASGVTLLVCNRPDNEAAEQSSYASIEAAAKKLGMAAVLLPFKAGKLSESQVQEFSGLLDDYDRVHAYCRSGNRSFCVFAASHASREKPEAEILELAKQVGFDVKAVIEPYYSSKKTPSSEVTVDGGAAAKPSFDVVVVGAGSGGIAIAASLLKRRRGLRIVIIDPAEDHYYQPGWTMVGRGVFDAKSTRRQTKDLIPHRVSWIKHAVVDFAPERNEIVLSDHQVIHYEHLVVAPGLTLDWNGIKGLKESLGKNGVTSNYSYDLAPYTWELVQGLKKGRALFTQPPMPIKCAGAPQKALYLSADYWQRAGIIKNIDIGFYNAGGVLFGVPAYVPALESYIEKYDAQVNFNHNLVEIDGENKVAHFKNSASDDEIVTTEFDMIHVCPPQRAPQFVAQSDLSDDAGWLDVDQFTLRHKRYANVWGLGDVMNTPNAKTMAAVRKQVPVVAQNISDVLSGKELASGYDGYGSCPLTVEKGKIVLAEFGYGGKLLPSFPSWMLEGTKPTRMAWILKADLLPPIYWHAMLKGREWLAGPKDLEKVKS